MKDAGLASTVQTVRRSGWHQGRGHLRHAFLPVLQTCTAPANGCVPLGSRPQLYLTFSRLLSMLKMSKVEVLSGTTDLPCRPMRASNGSGAQVRSSRRWRGRHQCDQMPDAPNVSEGTGIFRFKPISAVPVFLFEGPLGHQLSRRTPGQIGLALGCSLPAHSWKQAVRNSAAGPADGMDFPCPSNPRKAD